MKLLLNEKTKVINEKVSDIVEDFKIKLNQIFATDADDADKSKDSAKDRLKLVLMHDRSKLSPEDMRKMKDELVDVIAKYVEIDKESLDLNLENESGALALVANIPVLRNK